MLDELRDSAFVVELVRAFRLLALVAYGYTNAFVEKGFFPEPLGEFVEAELGRVENLCVRFEGNLRAAFSCLPGLFQLYDRDSALVLLLVGLPVAPDFQAKCF